MDSRSIDWLPNSFSRSPAWRILRADYRCEHALAPDSRIDDSWVEIALKLFTSTDVHDRTAVTTKRQKAQLKLFKAAQ